ncbi:MAG: hypothetical protein H7144_12250 [Burkholderiales bacterium]|nr:hypothetical protein [Phycisphaerae bacterium]
MTFQRRFLASIITFSIATGCGTAPVAPPQASVPEKLRTDDPETVAPAPAGSAAASVDPAKQDTASEAIARQTSAHARAINELLNAKQNDDRELRGVKVFEPTPDPATADQGNAGQPANLQPRIPPAPVAASGDAVIPSGTTVASAAAANAGASVGTPTVGINGGEPATVRPVPVDTSQAPADDSLEKFVAKRAREYPRDLAGQLDYQLVLFLKDEQVPRAADVANLATEDREVLTAMMDGLSNFRNAIRTDNNLLMNRKIRPLVEMSDRLRSRADLSIPTATLCREVKAFGVYTPFESARFTAGVKSAAIVYCEVENFSSQLNEKNMWQTKLTQDLVMYTESGLAVWKATEKLSDLCRNRRRDFYTIQVIELPANLNLGRYVLKVSIVDEQASRVAETSIPIAIVAK